MPIHELVKLVLQLVSNLLQFFDQTLIFELKNNPKLLSVNKLDLN